MFTFALDKVTCFVCSRFLLVLCFVLFVVQRLIRLSVVPLYDIKRLMTLQYLGAICINSYSVYNSNPQTELARKTFCKFKTTKRRQVFRWLHQQRENVIFLQETYSSPQTIKTWEAEWGGKIIESHGSNHSRGVMILFKPRLDVTTEKIVNDSNGRYILSEVLLDGERFVFLNIYSPNDQARQIQFLKNLSRLVLNSHANEKVMLFGDLNCVMYERDKRGGRPIIHKKGVI